MHVVDVVTFENWRDAARELLYANVSPDNVTWVDKRQVISARQPKACVEQESLFPNEKILPASKNLVSTNQTRLAPKIFTVSKEFLHLALYASCHRDDIKWPILYRVLWRYFHGEKHILALSSDDDVRTLKTMEKEVSRDRHKMKAFVRFKHICDEQGDDAYIAWHQPSHFVLRLAAPFFVRRFKAMKFAILTPEESIYWDKNELIVGEGQKREAAPQNDELESLWKTFYRHIFNPARIKVSMMKSEMPMKYWHTMPETELIPSMLAEAPERVRKMIKDSQQRE